MHKLNDMNECIEGYAPVCTLWSPQGDVHQRSACIHTCSYPSEALAWKNEDRRGDRNEKRGRRGGGGKRNLNGDTHLIRQDPVIGR